MKRALVIGSRGQDGRILGDRLGREGVHVVGLDVGVVDGAPDVAPIDLRDRAAVADLVAKTQPDAVFYFAAYHHSSEDAQLDDVAQAFATSFDVNVIGLVNVLEAVRRQRPACRAFYASSSHVFGAPARSPQDESTPLAPRNVYAVSKAAGMHACRFFREAHGLHVTVGILYNHESQYRPPRFVTQRIARGAVAARKAKDAGSPFELRLGSLGAVVDWGWASDYIDAMLRAVALPDPDDYVIATGQPHTVRDFAELAFRAVGLDYREFVREDPALLRKETTTLVGDASKLRAMTGWAPRTSFAQMIENLVQHAAAAA